MILNDYSQLQKIREQHRDQKIVFCSGSFDLPHAGHILFFEDCKKLGDILVVAVGCDAIIQVNKGEKRPILNEHIRIKTIDSLKPVDYCYLDASTRDPLNFLKIAFEHLQPDIYAVNDDGFELEKRREAAKNASVKFYILKRWCPDDFESISTSKIIHKIRNL